MKATEAKLPDFLKKSPEFVIPIYQRAWSWTEPQCRQLWEDILRTGQGFHLAGLVREIQLLQKMQQLRLTLLIAESNPKAKELMVRLVMNLLVVGSGAKRNEGA